jgi:hypothetical protein
MSHLSDLTTLAISRAVNAKADKTAREGVVAGTYHIDVTVRVRGTLAVAEDTDKTPTVKADIEATLVCGSSVNHIIEDVAAAA